MGIYLGLVLWRTKFLLLCIFVTFIIGCFIAVSPITLESCQCDSGRAPVFDYKSNDVHGENFVGETIDGHKLAVLVPFRDRFEELLQFVPYMHQFLKSQNVSHEIFVLNQVDKYRFNRASLINVGFREACPECDYIAMHDVDLLPLNPQLSYKFPESGPFHVASPQLHPRYNYSTFVGGILLIKRDDFKKVNGMSNKYWGWGLEDDEFFVRLREANLKVIRPQNITTGKNNTFRHIHDRGRRRRDMAKCYNQVQVTRRRDLETGLDSVSYSLLGINQLSVDGSRVTVLNVRLHCDHLITPWCDCSPNSGVSRHKKMK